MLKVSKPRPWRWIPTLYFSEGVPNVVVTAVAVVMYKRIGLGNAEIAFYTAWLYLPWVIKPFWSPIVDMLRTKRWWILAMQALMATALAGVALSIPAAAPLRWTLICFWLMAFASATHDIAADGYYMLALDERQQTFFVGIRSTFYRVASIVGQGLMIMFAGAVEVYTRQPDEAWAVTFWVCAALFVVLALWHRFALPRVEASRSTPSAGNKAGEFFSTFFLYFRRRHIGVALLFMLLYRLPEALLVKVCPLFLLDPIHRGGLGLSTIELGFVQGTIGVVGLLAGGVLGGMVMAHGGWRRWLWPMVWAISLPNVIYVLFAYYQPTGLATISAGVLIEQFGYGFGFTAYMVYLLHFARGPYQTAHYAFCTGFMALGLILPGMAAGWLQEHLGYLRFFNLVCIVTPITFIVSALALRAYREEEALEAAGEAQATK